MMKGKSTFQSKSFFSLSKLKFLLLGMLVVSLLGIFTVYGQDSVYLSTTHGKNEDYKSTLPDRSIKDLRDSGVEITYKFKGAVLAPMDVEGTTYYIPHIYGFSHMNEVGSPRLPAKNHHIAIPYGSHAVIEILDVQFKEYSDKYTIHPSLEPQPDCEGYREPDFEINREVYETDADFPEKVVEVLERETFMGVPVAVIQVRPMQINPVTKKLKAYSRIKFKVTFSGGERSFDRFAANSKHANQMVRNVVLNRGAIPTGVDTDENFQQTRNGRKDYIIIVHSDYLAAAEDLANLERQLGYTVEIVSQSSWTTIQVKEALQTRYDSWSPKPLYFLLFGDCEDVPAEYIGGTFTDLYYAEMDGNDYKPEMAYGRISPSSPSDAQVIVDKIINYVKNSPTNPEFYSNALACSSFRDSDLDGYEDGCEIYISEYMIEHIMGQGLDVNRVYYAESNVYPQYYNNICAPPNTPIPEELKKPGFPWDGDYNDIIDYIDAGRFLVWYLGHGDVTLWSDPYFTTTHINQLDNGPLLPLVWSISNLTGYFCGATECFAERFIRKNNGGCVGIIAPTDVIYTNYAYGFVLGLLYAIWPEEPEIDTPFSSGGAGNLIPAHDPIYTMGDLLNFGKTAMEYLYGTSQATWEVFHYFGDPAMQIRTSEPTDATATHPSSLYFGGTSLDITGSNCGGGLATLVYEDTLVGKTTLAGDGTGTITFPGLSGSESQAILTVSRHNYKPYVANIDVICGPAPTADFVGEPTSGIAPLTVNFTNQSIGFTSISWAFEGGIPSTSTEQNPTVCYNTPGTYDVSLTATNASGSHTVTKTDYITVTEYCTSSGNNQNYEYIAGVAVADLSNSSGPSPYTNFTNLTAHLIQGETVNVSLTPGFPVSAYTEWWKIWIDYNGNCELEEDEEVFSGNGFSTVTGSFPVREDTIIGDTRMRVSMKYSSYPMPCETFTYGEVEDYTVQISGSTPQPPVADFTASVTTIFEGESLTFTDLSAGNPTSWDWTFEGGTITGGSVQNPIVTYDTADTFDVSLTVTNSAGSDSETKVDYITVLSPTEIYVYDITQVIKKAGKYYSSRAVVTIMSSSAPVADATVYITWSGVVSGSASGVTGADGTVTFTSSSVKSTGPFTITVDNVTHPTMIYNPALNNETSDTIP
jgi:PKD repeat protein